MRQRTATWRDRVPWAAAATALLLTAACASQDQDPPGASSEAQSAASTAPGSEASGPGGPAPEERTASPRTASATPSPTAEAAPPLTVTIGGTGDLLPHSAVLDSARENAGGQGDFDFGPMFAEVADLIGGSDLSLCHLETPLSPENTDLTAQAGVFSFGSPRELARDVAGAGWDGCDFASNHTMDRGVSGLADTEDVLREAGLGYAGPSAQEQRAGRAEVYQTPEASVAHLAYTYTYPNDGSPTRTVPGEAPWLESWLWPVVGAEGILDDARRARRDGADFVVVSMHWGAEYQTEPTEQQREIARELLGSDDVDLILGTHTHVIQPCETIDGKHVLYGMGNLLSNQSPDTTDGNLRPETQEGMVAQVTLTRDAAGEVTSQFAMQPTRVDLDGHVVEAASPQTYPETYERTMATMRLLQDDGCGVQPLR